MCCAYCCSLRRVSILCVRCVCLIRYTRPFACSAATRRLHFAPPGLQLATSCDLILHHHRQILHLNRSLLSPTAPNLPLDVLYHSIALSVPQCCFSRVLCRCISRCRLFSAPSAPIRPPPVTVSCKVLDPTTSSPPVYALSTPSSLHTTSVFSRSSSWSWELPSYNDTPHRSPARTLQQSTRNGPIVQHDEPASTRSSNE